MLLGNNTFPEDPRVVAEATALTKAGMEVTVIAPRGPHQSRRERVAGIETLRFPLPADATSTPGLVAEHLYVTFAVLLRALGVLVRRRPDVVHVHNPPDTLVVVAAVCRALGVRVVYDHHDLAPEMYATHADGAPRPVVLTTLIRLERASCRLADRVLTANESHKALEVQRAGIPAGKVTVVRNGPDLELFAPQPADDDGFVVGWAGSMGFHDGIDQLLEAIRLVVARAPETRCVLVGGGEAFAESRRLAGRLGLEAHVRFTGPVAAADVPGLLAPAHVCAVTDPSNPYNDRCTMIKVMEYMALAKPIVAYDLPETRVSAGPAAVYVTPGHPEGIAEALLTLRGDPEARARLGAAGRRRVEDGLSWAHSVPALLGAYGSLGLLQGEVQ